MTTPPLETPMDADRIAQWAQSVGVSPNDEGFGLLALAYAAGERDALERAAKVQEERAFIRHGYDKHGDADAIRALIEKETT